VSIFLQGSYKNRTNVRRESDVDIIVRLDEVYVGDIRELSDADKQKYNAIPNAVCTFPEFKNDIQVALEKEFGSGFVKRHSKCVKVLKDTQRVDADVTPCLIHKRFQSYDVTGAEGLCFWADNREYIISFPEQHYDNGVGKNDETKRMYKGIVRILKNIRNQLVDGSVIPQKDMPSFFLECLVWNVPNSLFFVPTYRAAIRSIVATIWSDMGDPSKASDYAEVSDLRWLFRGNSHRTFQQARSFMEHAWTFVEN